jgi:hypothetical protein
MDDDAGKDSDRDDKAEPEEAKPAPPPPLPKKLPEAPDTLKRRREWFRKRSE